MQMLQLGAFDQGLENWVNTDITPHLFVAKVRGFALLLHKVGVLSEHRYGQHRAGIFARLRYLNVAREFRFPNEAFDYVYSSHMLEHLHPNEARFCLREVHRVLKPGGVLRIAVPDLDKIIKKYVPEHPEAFLEEFFELNQRWAKNMHHWHYNEFSLRKSLEDAGFQMIMREAFRRGRCPDLDRIECREESLFVEAVR